MDNLTTREAYYIDYGGLILFIWLSQSPLIAVMGGQLPHSSNVDHRKPVDKSEITFLLLVYRCGGSQSLMLDIRESRGRKHSAIQQVFQWRYEVRTHRIILNHTRMGCVLIAKFHEATTTGTCPPPLFKPAQRSSKKIVQEDW